MSKEDNDDSDLVDFEPVESITTENGSKDLKKEANKVKQGYSSVNSSGFRDFLLKPELLKGIVDCGFEHPSEVQHKCIPQAILGMDVICQAKAGMGKTAVFVLSVLQQLKVVDNQCQCLVICHTRELAYQCCKEFLRFSKYLPNVKTAVFYGGIHISQNIELLKSETPNIVVGTPGRLLALVREKHLNVSKVKYFVLDECDKVLESLDMRQDIQTIFKATPKNKQVMMFSATFSKSIKEVAKKFMKDPEEIYVDNESKLVLHGLQQYYVKISEKQKTRKLNELLDVLEFNQVVIFVKSRERAIYLNKVLVENCFPSICIHSKISQNERIRRYKSFKEFEKRILVATDLFGRGIDIERVNIVINFDMSEDADSYLHRVGRAGRFGSKGLAVSFIIKDEVLEKPRESQIGRKRKHFKSKTDAQILEEIHERFSVKISPLPDNVDISSYMTS